MQKLKTENSINKTKTRKIGLSIIIVNWNGEAVLPDCLSSIYDNTTLSFEVIVVDNNSRDNSVSLIKNNFPEVIVLEKKENLGFSRGNNLGFRHARGDTILILNSDTIFLGDAVDNMVDFLKIHPEIGIIGPKVLNPDRTPGSDNKRKLPTLYRSLLELFLIKKIKEVIIKSLSRFSIFNTLSKDYYNKSGEAEAMDGGCLLMRRSTFELLNGFDEDVPMYLDDIDILFRARLLGLKNYYLADARMIHIGQHSTKQAKDYKSYDLISLRAKIFYFKKHFSKLHSILYRLFIILSVPYLLILDLLTLPIFILLGKTKHKFMVIKKHAKYFQAAIVDKNKTI